MPFANVMMPVYTQKSADKTVKYGFSIILAQVPELWLGGDGGRIYVSILYLCRLRPHIPVKLTFLQIPTPDARLALYTTVVGGADFHNYRANNYNRHKDPGCHLPGKIVFLPRDFEEGPLWLHRRIKERPNLKKAKAYDAPAYAPPRLSPVPAHPDLPARRKPKRKRAGKAAAKPSGGPHARETPSKRRKTGKR